VPSLYPKPSQTFVYVSTIQRMARNLFGAEGCLPQGSDDAEVEADADRLDLERRSSPLWVTPP